MTWLFTYAELMGEHLLRSYDVQPAVLPGYRRRFLHGSTLLWGTPGHPCPLVGVVPDGECPGLAFRVPWSARRAMLRRLEPTENSGEYRRVRLPVTLGGGGEERALVWVSDPALAGGARWADEDGLREALLAAHGTAGRGVEYVRTIYHALELWGLRDPLIESVWARLAAWRPR
jgi:cation transport regulator ChaC